MDMGRTPLFIMLLHYVFLARSISPTVAAARRTVALPLHTQMRWIVDGTQKRVKLACLNWVAHLEAGVAEGLNKQPVDAISKKLKILGYNCARLTWATFLVTNDTFGNLTVRQSLKNLGLLESIAGFKANNPTLLDLTLLNAFQAVVSNLADNNVMIILDNHITQPIWCCSNFDGNGFFGDPFFDPEIWLTGLTRMATIFESVPNVIGMSLRNELRGPKQNITDWFWYMQKGAEAVHSANKNVLVILAGLSYTTDLSFLSNHTVNLTFTGKLVFENHFYSFFDKSAWVTTNPNDMCGRATRNAYNKGLFLLDKGFPVFVSEFGVDQRGINVNDNRFMNCFFCIAASFDLDLSVWVLAGSYYYRENTIGMEEFYGILDWSWCSVRNASFLQRLSSLQLPFQGPGLSETKPYKLLFHSLSGQCARIDPKLGILTLGNCFESDMWLYSPQKTLTIAGTRSCLQADGYGKAARLGSCKNEPSKWNTISNSHLHLSTRLSDGGQVCLEVIARNSIATNPCNCLSRNNCNPEAQWFKLVDSTRRPKTKKMQEGN